jgi:ParB-like chromosome segregation protein Spo0J
MQPSEPFSNGNTPVQPQFEPAQLLAELVATAAGNGAHRRPDRLSRDAITVMPELFQPRGMSEKHIGDLIKAIERFGEVEPLTVLPMGATAILVDGHHRLAAYEKAEKVAAIPVRYFEGSPEEAVLEAGNANSRAKLPMTTQERQNYAWRLVLLDTHSKAKIARAAGVSQAQVAKMRVVRKALGEDAYEFASWWLARNHANGPVEEMGDDDREQWKQDLADRFADRLVKEFSTKLADRPEVAAMALSTYFGRRLPEVVNELMSFLPEEGGEDEF